MTLGFDPVAANVLQGQARQSAARTLTPEALWSRLAPRLRRFGITRVADVTGLDHLGFPVAQAVRPMARSNAVTQGKAPSLAGAAVGAVLECLEMASGEDLQALVPVASQTDQCDPGGLWATRAPGAHWPDAQTPFVAAWNITQDAPAAVPRDLLSTDFARGATAEAAPVLRHSIGLGAGTSWAAALQQGLLECLEADARIRADRVPQALPLDLSHEDPVYGALLRRVICANMRVSAQLLPCRGPVIAVGISLMEAPGPSSLPLPATGFAARLNGAEAVAAALAEAVQARLAVISGAREDMTQALYAHGLSAQSLRDVWEAHGPCHGLALPPATGPGATVSDLAQIAGPVFAVPLLWVPEVPLAVCRVLAPGLLSDPLTPDLDRRTDILGDPARAQGPDTGHPPAAAHETRP